MQNKSDEKGWDLIAGKLNDELDANEGKIFDDWLSERGNRQVYEQSEKLHQQIQQTKLIDQIDTEKAWRKVDQKSWTPKGISRKLMPWLGYAAIFLLALLIGSLLGGRNNFKHSAEMCSVTVPFGQTSLVTLYDGTKVWLNSGAELRYDAGFNIENREVWIDGEAFFEVTHQNGSPFRVNNKKGIVEVLGTSFNVESYLDDDLIKVTLEEGVVQFKSPRGKLLRTLKPSEQVTLDVSVDKMKVERVRTDLFTSWKEGRLEMDKASLSEVVKKLERWYNVDIRFATPEVGEIKLTGTILRDRPLDQILKVFERLYGYSYDFTVNADKKSEITLYVKQPNK
ncbi:FecR family protein [Sunxiuqinia elliptica]